MQKNEICDQNVTEVKNWHALYNKRKTHFPGQSWGEWTQFWKKEKETLTSHKSATAGFTGKVGCITTTAPEIFKVYFRTTQLKIVFE